MPDKVEKPLLIRKTVAYPESVETPEFKRLLARRQNNFSQLFRDAVGALIREETGDNGAASVPDPSKPLATLPLSLLGVLPKPLTHDFSYEISTADDLVVVVQDFSTWAGIHDHGVLLSDRRYKRDKSTRLIIIDSPDNIDGQIPSPRTSDALRRHFRFSDFRQRFPSFDTEFILIVTAHASYQFAVMADNNCWVVPYVGAARTPWALKLWDVDPSTGLLKGPIRSGISDLLWERDADEGYTPRNDFEKLLGYPP